MFDSGPFSQRFETVVGPVSLVEVLNVCGRLLESIQKSSKIKKKIGDKMFLNI